MTWVQPAMIFAALASALLAVTFVYVWWNFIRRRYVLLWAAAWGLAVPQILLHLRMAGGGEHPIAWSLQQVLLVMNAMLMVAGCYEFVHRRLPPRLLGVVAAPCFAWALLGPSVSERFMEMTLPSSILLGASYIFASTRFVSLWRERRTRGARLVAILFLTAGIHELDYPLLGDIVWFAPIGYSATAVLAIAIALFLLVTILEEARSQAEAERSRTRAILDNLPVGVLVTDRSGAVVLANSIARQLTAHVSIDQNVSELEGEMFRMPDLEPCPPDDLPIGRALRTGEESPARELARVGPDGSGRPVLVNAGPVRDEHGVQQGAVAVFQDIAELKKLQAEMARSERLQGLGTLAAGVAHDFNNALAMILGHAEIGLRAAPTPLVRDELAVILRVATDSAAIVRRIQDLARTRVTANDQIRCELDGIVREVVEISRPRWQTEAQARGVRFELSTELSQGGAVLGRPEELREALLNLVFNALDAMPAGGRLCLSVARNGTEALLAVKDDGLGMSSDVVERIFDPYFTTKGTQGTGLGLAIVFGIVQRNGGRIEVESELGSGTTFSLRFPLAAAEEVVELAQSEPAAVRPLRILAVDDERLIRTLMVAVLEIDGHEVVTAGGGEEACRVAREQDFDLVISDLGMPDMNGWEVALDVKARRPETRVIIVTGWGDSLTAAEIAAAGVDRVLPKPFTHKQLLSCVQEVGCSPRQELALV